MSNAEMIEDLRRADDVLRERGWIQSKMEDYQGHVCLIGAMRRAFGYNQFQIIGEPRYYDIAQYISLYLAEEYGCGGIVDWNDREERTQEDVHLMLKSAIAKLEEGL